MKKRWWVLLGFVGLVAGYFAWVSRPEFSDRAELTDTCSFPTITNAEYRALIAEAKTLIEPRRQAIADGAGNIEQLSPNPPLQNVAVEFVKKSQSTEETFVRLHAFGRALDGREHDVAPAQAYQYPGPWVIWSEWDSAGQKSPKHRLSMYAEFQAPPGLFRWTMETWLWARLLGRRYESFRVNFWFDPPKTFAPEDALAGRHIVDAGARKGLLVWPLNSMRWGDLRLENRCPHAGNFLNHLDGLLKRGKN